VRGRVRESCLRQSAQQVERGSGGVGRLSGTDRAPPRWRDASRERYFGVLSTVPPPLSAQFTCTVRESVKFRGGALSR
jgi:hypothetical protein